MIKRSLSIVLIILPFLVLNASSNEEGGVPGAYLSWGAGVRALGMGRAYVGLSENASSVYWNSAGLPQARGREINTQYSMLWEDTHYGFLSFITPLNIGWKEGSIGIGIVNLTSAGYEKTDLYNNLLQEDANDIETTGIISYGIKLMPTLNIGAGIKIVNQNVDVYSDTGFGGDIGLLYKPKSKYSFIDKRVSIGVNVQNIIQPKLKLKKTTEKFPIDFKMGLAYRIIPDKLLFVGDINKNKYISYNMNVGTEYMFNDMFSLRAGYNKNEFTGGIGVKIKDIDINYAYAYHKVLFREGLSLNSSHRIGINILFPVKKEKEGVNTIKEESLERQRSSKPTEEKTEDQAITEEKENKNTLKDNEKIKELNEKDKIKDNKEKKYIEYNVKTWQNKKECLWNISGRKDIYGDPYKWKKIYKANKDKISDPNLIFPGQTLRILIDIE